MARYLEEQGYRWDVYAFGVLAYRLLTGAFPRCDEVFRKVAPDDFVHPVDALRWYLGERPAGGHDITAASHGLGRVSVIGAVPGDERRGVPVSEFGGEGIVQPTQGAGASWQKRGIVPQP